MRSRPIYSGRDPLSSHPSMGTRHDRLSLTPGQDRLNKKVTAHHKQWKEFANNMSLSFCFENKKFFNIKARFSEFI